MSPGQSHPSPPGVPYGVGQVVPPVVLPNILPIVLPIVMGIGAIFALLLATHSGHLDGPDYWKWPWRRLNGWRYFPAMALCAMPLFAALFIHGPSRLRTALAISMVMISMLAMQIVHIGLTVTPFNLSRIIYFVQSPMSTSYFADADRSIDVPVLDLLSNYPGYMPQFFMHSQEKPPGPILFFRAILMAFGPSDTTALIAGILVGFLATLCIPATYWLINVLLRDGSAAFAGCVLLALCPGLTLHFPMLDQIYPAITCPILITWIMALRTGKISLAIAYGVALAMGCFIVYHFLVLGAFLTITTIAYIIPSPQKMLPRVLGLAFAAIATFCAIYFALFALTGFNAKAVFLTALVEQEKHLAVLVRPYPRTILFDLADFALGAGWLPVALAILLLIDRAVPIQWRRWSALGLFQILLIALIGLMQAETARIWCFLLPLLVLPAGAEVSRLPIKPRLAIYLAAWVLLCLVGQNLTFMY